MTFFKMKKWREAESDCTEALKLDPKNVKVWWRRAMSRKALGEYEKAKMDLEKGLIFDSTQTLLREELEKLHIETQNALLLAERKQASSDQQPISKPPSTTRRRVPIREVMEDAPIVLREQNVPELTIDSKQTYLKRTMSESLRPPENSLDFERTFRSLKHQPERLYTYLQVSVTREKKSFSSM